MCDKRRKRERRKDERMEKVERRGKESEGRGEMEGDSGFLFLQK